MDENKEELEDTARIWRVVNDEADRIDLELILRWISILDNQFLFVC